MTALTTLLRTAFDVSEMSISAPLIGSYGWWVAERRDGVFEPRYGFAPAHVHGERLPEHEIFSGDFDIGLSAWAEYPFMFVKSVVGDGTLVVCSDNLRAVAFVRESGELLGVYWTGHNVSTFDDQIHRAVERQYRGDIETFGIEELAQGEVMRRRYLVRR